MADAKPIECYFEFAGPYGYFASLKIDGLAAKYGRTVDWRPFMLGALFKFTNSAPHMTMPMKGDYFYWGIARSAKMMGISLAQPEKLPMNSPAAMRAFYRLLDDRPEQVKYFARAVYEEHWGKGRDMAPVEAVAETASRLGIDGDALVAAKRNEVVKDRLKRETEMAIARGAFGSSFIFVDDEPFWGADRLDQVERWLQTGGF